MVFEQEHTDTINVKYSKLDGVISFFKNIIGYKTILFVLILLISSMIDIFGYNPIPFVMLGVATVFKIPLLLPAVVSIISMLVVKADISAIIFYLITNIIYTIVIVTVNIQEISRKAAVGIKLAISMAIMTIIMFVFNGFNLGLLLDKIALIFLVQSLYYIYIYGFYFLSNLDRNMIYSVEEIVAMAIMVMITLTPIFYLGSMGGIIWTTIAIIFSILIGYTGGIASGIAVSTVLGFLVTIISKDINMLLLISVPGIISSLLNRINKSLAIIGVIFGTIILNYIVERNLVISIEIIQTAIAALIILILPKKITVILEEIFNKNITLKHAYEKELGVGSDIKNKLSAMSEVFDNLSNITLASNKEYYEETQKVVAKYLTDYKESKCLKCQRRYYCLKDNIYLVSSYIAKKLENNDEITENMLPVDCEEADIMIKEIRDIYNNMKLMRIIKQKEEENNIKLAKEYKEVATLIKNMSRDVSKTPKEVSYTQKCIRQELKLLGYQIYDDNYIDENDNKMYEFITDILKDIDASKNEIQTVIGEILGQKMNIKLILNSSKNERSRIKLVSEGKYSISSEIYQRNKSNNEISGDKYYLSEIKNGKIIAISDGMGSGEEAANMSGIVITMLDKLLLSGFNNTTITKIINGVVKLKEESNVSASVDMTIINTKTNKINLLKMGAAPTYIISSLGVQEFECDNMPIGLVDGSETLEHEIGIDIPMIIVNISDGAYSKGLKEYFEFISKKNLNIISKREIINGIVERIEDDMKDDSTIIITKVE